MEKDKHLVVKPDTHNLIKEYAVKNKMTINDYLLYLIDKVEN